MQERTRRRRQACGHHCLGVSPRPIAATTIQLTTSTITPTPPLGAVASRTFDLRCGDW